MAEHFLVTSDGTMIPSNRKPIHVKDSPRLAKCPHVKPIFWLFVPVEWMRKNRPIVDRFDSMITWSLIDREQHLGLYVLESETFFVTAWEEG